MEQSFYIVRDTEGNEAATFWANEGLIISCVEEYPDCTSQEDINQSVEQSND